MPVTNITSMRPSAFANGNRITRIRFMLSPTYFNEAVGFRQRKCWNPAREVSQSARLQ